MPRSALVLLVALGWVAALALFFYTFCAPAMEGSLFNQAIAPFGDRKLKLHAAALIDDEEDQTEEDLIRLLKSQESMEGLEEEASSSSSSSEEWIVHEPIRDEWFRDWMKIDPLYEPHEEFLKFMLSMCSLHEVIYGT